MQIFLEQLLKDTEERAYKYLDKQLKELLPRTYARPSRGHIKQLKNQLWHTTKGSMSIADDLHFVKRIVHELAILGKPMIPEDRILDGLDTDQPVIDAVHARDSPITFDELLEKFSTYSLLPN